MLTETPLDCIPTPTSDSRAGNSHLHTTLTCCCCRHSVCEGLAMNLNASSPITEGSVALRSRSRSLTEEDGTAKATPTPLVGPGLSNLRKYSAQLRGVGARGMGEG